MSVPNFVSLAYRGPPKVHRLKASSLGLSLMEDCVLKSEG